MVHQLYRNSPLPNFTNLFLLTNDSHDANQPRFRIAIEFSVQLVEKKWTNRTIGMFSDGINAAAIRRIDSVYKIACSREQSEQRGMRTLVQIQTTAV